MLHVRVVTPPDRRAVLVEMLEDEPSVIDLVVLEGAATKPRGDVVQFDVPPEAANDLIEAMRDLELHKDGSISVIRIDSAPSRVARAAEHAAPGLSSEAVLWSEVETRVREGARATPSFYSFIVVAALIAAVAVLIDSSILVVGAMVVSPDYGPVAGIAAGLALGRSRVVRHGGVALLTGIAAGIVAAFVLGLVIDLIGETPEIYLSGDRPETGFISEPDIFVVLVAVFAGVAGALSLTEARSGPLVGVFISVTTIPAIAAIGVALAIEPDRAGGAALQLLINVTVLIVVGVVTIWVQRGLLRRYHHLRQASLSTNDSS
jgi:uncharacterized hydrophobic protein (TIGR00271 family)